MNTYRIFTDSACDIPAAKLRELGVSSLSLTFRFSDDNKEYYNDGMTPAEFYDRMRKGGVAKTSAVNSTAFETELDDVLAGGEDVLYIGFSSGLSTTYNSALAAIKTLSAKYPERKLMAVDTRSASLGFGLLLYLTAGKKAEGATIEEAYEYASSLVPTLCHWFTVDDLVYLKRGGRISAATAIVGNMLGIKPVLHMDEAGHLISMSKVRGRRASIIALADKYGELHDATKDGTVYISHGDCDEDVETLKAILSEKYGATVELVSYVGPVIGAHSGPKTLALFFIGKER
jgi:DegV family protein with EDD domain